MGNLVRKTGSVSALHLVSRVENAEELAGVVKASDVLENHTVGYFEALGKRRFLRTTLRLSDNAICAIPGAVAAILAFASLLWNLAQTGAPKSYANPQMDRGKTERRYRSAAARAETGSTKSKTVRSTLSLPRSQNWPTSETKRMQVSADCERVTPLHSRGFVARAFTGDGYARGRNAPNVP